MPTPHFPVTEFLSSGEPLAVVSPDQAEVAAAGARTADWTVLLAESADGSGLRALQAGLAESLDLPGAAAVNLDALVDALRDLPDRTPDAPGTLLVWTPAEGIGLEDDGLATLLELLAETAAEGGTPRLAVLVSSAAVVRQLEEGEA
ncbi:barstar family protein [Kytococcus sedentarius]|uniref:barstar family protein n=1 Tax=Kytococcus sedentarius TaxID=1276 RepID=UPI00387A38DB